MCVHVCVSQWSYTVTALMASETVLTMRSLGGGVTEEESSEASFMVARLATTKQIVKWI